MILEDLLQVGWLTLFVLIAIPQCVAISGGVNAPVVLLIILDEPEKPRISNPKKSLSAELLLPMKQTLKHQGSDMRASSSGTSGWRMLISPPPHESSSYPCVGKSAV